ncbi:MAG: MMPL family transporter, partial [Pseudomonadota bacterium]
MPSKGSNPAITLATLLLVFVAGAGLPGLTSSSHYSVYFDRDDPSRLNHEAIQLEYGRGDSLIVLLDSKEGTFLDAERWFLLEDLADGLRQLPDVSVVIAASELNIGGVIETPSGQLIPDRDALADHGRVFGLLLSDDATLAAVAVDIPLTDHRAQTALARNAAVREVVDRFTRDSPVEASYTGTLAMSAAYVDVVRSDLRVIMPMLLVTMFVLLGALLGGWRAIGAALPIGLLAVASAFGIAGWLSAELAAINTFAPIMILSIGTAGCVHLLLHYQRLRAGGAPPSEAAVRARRQVMLPMSIANATTILGFLALLLSPSPPLRIVGYTVAAGVSVSWLLCVTLMPAMLARLDPRGATALGMYPTLRSLVGFVTRRNTAILVGAAAIGIIAAALVTQNRVSDSVLSYFPGSQPFTAATETADRKLAGVTELLIDLDAGEPSALLSESQVRAVADYVAWLRDQPETVRVSSLLDSEVLRAAIDAQRLEALLSRAADRTVGQLERREVNAERSRMLIAVHLEPLASGEIIEFEARARAAAIGLIPGLDITTGGTNLIFAKLGETNIRSMMLALSFG